MKRLCFVCSLLLLAATAMFGQVMTVKSGDLKIGSSFQEVLAHFPGMEVEMFSDGSAQTPIVQISDDELAVYRMQFIDGKLKWYQFLISSRADIVPVYEDIYAGFAQNYSVNECGEFFDHEKNIVITLDNEVIKVTYH